MKRIKLAFIDKIKEKCYISYPVRVILSCICFLITLTLGLLLLFNSFKVYSSKIVSYSENGSIDYKVYLKPNEFYEQSYLGKNQYYVTSLIKNIEIIPSYNFLIDEPINLNLNYDVTAKLTITSSDGANTLYEKSYPLLSRKTKKVENSTTANISEKITVDYDYYNAIANNFKNTYGVETASNLAIHINVSKNGSNASEMINLNETGSMVLTIPLTQRTMSIQANEAALNNTKNIIEDGRVELGNIAFIVLSIILFLFAIVSLSKFMKLIILLFGKGPSKYDRYIKKILSEYDRLIVETPTKLNIENENIIKIRKFEELLDARDNLKAPIMYQNVVEHQKSYFYIKTDKECYLLVLKAVDFEVKHEKNK